MARELAKRVGYVYVDSGAMYRAVTLYALRHGMVNADHAVNRKGTRGRSSFNPCLFSAGGETAASSTPF